MSHAGWVDRSQPYRRQARRIRSRCAGQPDRLYRSLRQLSDRHDASVAQVAPRYAIPPGSPRQSDAFARLVADRLEGKLLRYSERRDLLQIATCLGMSRFHANLIIAAVQHQRGEMTLDPAAPRRTVLWPWVAAAAVVVQSGIVLAAWKLFAS